MLSFGMLESSFLAISSLTSSLILVSWRAWLLIYCSCLKKVDILREAVVAFEFEDRSLLFKDVD